MNEIELIRTQLATERMHLREIAAASIGPGDGVARREYLAQVLGWFAARDERLGQLLPVPDGSARAALAEALSAAGSSREALDRLPEAPGGSTQEWRTFAHFVAGDWASRRGRLDELLAQEPLVTWRAVAGIDADSVLEERALYARARSHADG